MNFLALVQIQTHLLGYLFFFFFLSMLTMCSGGKYLQIFLEAARSHGERRELGGWEGFERNTVLPISAAAPVPVQGAEVFSVKNTLRILVTERRVKHKAGECVCWRERGKGRECEWGGRASLCSRWL